MTAMQATLLFALLLFWTAHALTINLTSEGLRNDEWWSIACVYNTSHFTGKFLSSIYSHESEVLWFYFVNANPDSQKGQLIDIRTNTNNTLTKPLTSTPLPDGTYQFRFAFKQNGSLFTGTDWYDWELSVNSNVTAEEIARIRVIGTTAVSCVPYLECYRST